MNGSDDLHPALTGRPTTVKGSPELIELSDRSARIVKVSVVIVLGLLIWWPVVLLAIVVIVPTIVIAAILAAPVVAIAGPIWLLVRRVRARHRAQQSILSLSRLRP